MKRMIFGSIMLVLGMVCASGDTIANGIMACVFMGVAAIALRGAEVRSNGQTLSNSPLKGEDYAKAA